MTDKQFIEFFNNLIEASCGRRGCAAKELPGDQVEQAEEIETHEGYPEGVV